MKHTFVPRDPVAARIRVSHPGETSVPKLYPDRTARAYAVAGPGKPGDFGFASIPSVWEAG